MTHNSQILNWGDLSPQRSFTFLLCCSDFFRFIVRVREIRFPVWFPFIAERWLRGSYQGDCEEESFQDSKSSCKGNKNSEGKKELHLFCSVGLLHDMLLLLHDHHNYICPRGKFRQKMEIVHAVVMCTGINFSLHNDCAWSQGKKVNFRDWVN